MINNSNFILLISGIPNNDRIVKKLTGRQKPIYYKTRYTPPYENFEELRRLLLRVKSVDEVNAENTIAVDISEWEGHENEEYFTVMLKYFHDQCDHWAYIFTVGNLSAERASGLYLMLKSYLKGGIVYDHTFDSAEFLSAYIYENYNTTPLLCERLSDLLMQKEFRDHLGFEFMESILDELFEISGGRHLLCDHLKKYLARTDTIISLLTKSNCTSQERWPTKNEL